jgi:enamine deaminase RidA (YjgF/YER057c/UK114 family)
MFVKAYNEAREHGGINGLTPSEMFLQRLITSTKDTTQKEKQHSTRAQMRQSYANIKKILAKYVATMENIVDEILFVTNMNTAFAAAVKCRKDIFSGFPGQIPDRLVRNVINLEGHDLIAVELGHTDTDHTTCLNVPSVGSVVEKMTPEEQNQVQSIAERYRQTLYPPDYLD